MQYSNYIDGFLKHGFFLPPYICNSDLESIYQIAIANEDSLEFYKRITPLFDRCFNEARLAAFYNEVYKKNHFIKKFHKQIIEAITAYKIGYVSISVAALVSVVEGCIEDIFKEITCLEHLSDIKFPVKDYSDKYGNARDLYFKEKLTEITDYILLKANCEDNQVYQERIDVIVSFKKYITSKFWDRAQNKSEPSNLSRHGINHGVYSSEEFSNPINFYKLLMMINYFNFACAFIGFNGSVGDPKYYPEHEQTEKILSLARFLNQKNLLNHL